MGYEKDSETSSLIQKADSSSSGEKKAEGFGVKQIGFIGGVALMVNNITGPGMVTIPVMFQQAGWMSPIIIMLMITIMTGLASTLLCQAMTKIPGNEFFQGRAELSTVAKYFFPKWGYWTTLVLLNVSLLAVNISAIIVSAQVSSHY